MSTAIMPSSAASLDLDLWMKNGMSGSMGSSSSNSSSLSSSFSNSSSAIVISQLVSLKWSQPQDEHQNVSRRISSPGSISSLVDSLLSDHKRPLDRSQSDPTKAIMSVNTSRYKTELCRPFEESGYCKYGDKCQFAHGEHDMRSLTRHPKYKTELCRTFHTDGFCPYGARCHFIHEEEGRAGTSVAKQHRPRPLCLRTASLSSTAGTPSPPSSLGSGSPPPSATANTAFSFSALVPSPARSLSPLSSTQSPPPRSASPDARLPVFNKLSGPNGLQFVLCLGDTFYN